MREQRAVVREDADYVVVGAGGAGCIVAARLAESGRHRVVVLEAGGPDSSIWIRIPAGFTRTVYDTKLNWNYVTAAGDHIAGRCTRTSLSSPLFNAFKSVSSILFPRQQQQRNVPRGAGGGGGLSVTETSSSST